MNWFLRTFGMMRLMDEANGESDELAGGNSGAGNAIVDDKKDDAPAPVKVEDMAAAIEEGLANGGKEVIKDAAVKVDDKAGQRTAAEQVAFEEAERVKAERAAMPEADRLAAEEKDRTDALLKKKPDDFVLNEVDKKVLGVKAQERFQELTKFGKVHYERAEQAAQQVQELTATRDGLLKTFKENLAEPGDVAKLLDLNYRIKSGDLEGALAVLNTTRKSILKSLGREEDGVDLLEEFADLQERVADNAITREDALEIAQGRRRDAAIAARQRGNEITQHQQNQIAQAQDNGLKDIEEWTKRMAGSDIDYKAKEAKVVPMVENVIKNYPPNLWVATIENLYKAITVVKDPVLPRKGALRPNGATPGAKAPADMTDAISQGLGYSA